MSLPQQNRLKSSRDFNRVHRKGQRTATKHLAIRALKVKASPKNISTKNIRGSTKGNAREDAKAHTRGVDGLPSTPSPHGHANGERVDRSASPPSIQCAAPKIGISISRKVSKRAVIRNRIKRQLRAIMYGYLPMIEPGWQVVIVVRPPAVECSFDDFLRELDYLLKKLKIVI